MANEIPNAVSLMQSSLFRDWVRAAIVYKARDVITEATTVADHAKRVELAAIVAVNPDQHLNIFVNAIACDPAVASVGAEVGEGTGRVGQALLLDRIGLIWTPLAKLLYPTPIA